LELQDLHFSVRKCTAYQIEKNEMGEACSTHWRDHNSYNIWVGKPERRRLLGRAWRRWEDNILKLLLRKEGGKVWTGCIWLRIGTNDEPF
jgi:hypothetical protein